MLSVIFAQQIPLLNSEEIDVKCPKNPLHLVFANCTNIAANYNLIDASDVTINDAFLSFRDNHGQTK